MRLKERVFYPSMRNFVFCSLPFFTAAGFLIYWGYSNYQLPPNRPPVADSITFFMMVLLPVGLGVAVALLVASVALAQWGRSIAYSPVDVVLRAPRAETPIPWSQAIIIGADRRGTKGLRNFIISDGAKAFFRVDEFFYPEYELMVEVARRASTVDRSEVVLGG